MDLLRSCRSGGFRARVRTSLEPACKPRCLDRKLTYVILVSILISQDRVEGAAFTAGNVLVLIPQGTTNAATTISLKEYSPAGTAGQTIPVTPSCTMSGSATSEGKLQTSFDGSRVSFGCYICASGTPSVASVS